MTPATEEELIKIAKEMLPRHCIDGLCAYVFRGQRPGGFLTAVLSNDLFGAGARADEHNKHALFEYCYFIFSFTPSQCWGSAEKVEAWINRRGINGRAENV